MTSPAADVGTYTSIVTAGPLEQLTVSDQLNCQVLHTADAQAQIYPSLDYEHGACGTQVAYGGQVYGPADVPGGNDPQDFVPVSQSAVTGDGTATTPYRIVTTVMAGVLEIVQADTHIEGREHYRTDVTVSNTGPGPVSVTVYRFGDCYVHEDDQGYGRVVGPGGIACTTHPTDPRPGMLIWMPLTAGSDYFEGSFEGLYNAISAGAPFASACECGTLHENAAGLSWTATIEDGRSATFSHTMQIAPSGTDSIALPETPPGDPPSDPPGEPPGDPPSDPPGEPPGEPPPATDPPANPPPVTDPPPDSPPVTDPPPVSNARAIAKACAQRLAGRSQWAGTLSISKRAKRLMVMVRPAKALRAVRVELRRAKPCSARGRPMAGARKARARAGRRTMIEVTLSQRMRPGSYVVLVSGRQAGRMMRSASVVTIR